MQYTELTREQAFYIAHGLQYEFIWRDSIYDNKEAQRGLSNRCMLPRPSKFVVFGGVLKLTVGAMACPLHSPPFFSSLRPWSEMAQFQ